MRCKERDIGYVNAMKIVYRSRATDDFNTPLLVGIGAHYSERMVPRDDMLLHIVKEAEILAGRPYSVLYFHSNVTLGAKPQVG